MYNKYDNFTTIVQYQEIENIEKISLFISYAL